MKSTRMALGLLLALAVVTGERALAQQTNSIDGTITVTPVASVMLQLSPTFYAFGVVDVNTTTNSITALVLSSTGTVGATMQKNVLVESAPSGWTAQAAAGADQYVLHAIAQSGVPGASTALDAATKFAAGNALNNLTNNGTTQTALSASGTVNLWYRLVLPTTTTSQAARTITLRYTGTAQ